MVMRISTPTIFERGIGQITDLHRQLSDVQQQLSTGLRINKPSDDPVATTQIMRVQQEIALTDQYQNNAIFLENRLGLEEVALGSVEDVLQRVRELVVQAGDGINTLQDRRNIATEIRQRQQQLQDLMNTRDGSGEYVFSGFQGNDQPFVTRTIDGFSYNGDDGQRFLQISPTTRIASSDAGSSLFVDVPSVNTTIRSSESPLNTGAGAVSQGEVTDQLTWDTFAPDDVVIEITAGNTLQVTNRQTGAVLSGNYSTGFSGPLTAVPFVSGETIQVAGIEFRISGSPALGDEFLVESSPTQDLLTTVDRLAFGLENLGDNETQLAEVQVLLSESLQNLDAAFDRVNTGIAAIGARVNTVRSTVDFNEDFLLVAKSTLSDLRDTDFAEAASKLSQLNVTLQAAQQSFVRLTNLSLFNFLR